MRLALGALSALLSALLFGISPLLYRVGMRRFPPFRANAIRLALILPLLVMIAAARGLLKPSLLLSALPYAILISISGSLVGDGLYFLAVSKLGAGLATAISYTYPIFTILVILACGGHVGIQEAVAAGIAVTGIWLCSVERGADDPRWRLGLAAGIGAAALWGVSVVIAKYAIAIFPAEILMLLEIAIATIALSPLLPRRLEDYLSRETAYLVAGACIAMIIGLYLYFMALRYIDATVVATITGISPAITLMLSSQLLGERLRRRQLVGALLAIIGAILAGLSI